MAGGQGGGPGGPQLNGDAPLLIKAVLALSTLCGWIAAGMIVAAIAITCQMIFLRYALNASTIWQTEAVTYLMIAATLIGLPYVQKLRGHVNVDALPRLLGRRGRLALAVLVQSLSIGVIALMAYYGFEYWYEAWDWGETSNTPWDIKLWVPYLTLPVGFGLFLLQLIADLLSVLLGHESPFGVEEADRAAEEAREARRRDAEAQAASPAAATDMERLS